jgi:Cu2+-exporting ATPase
MDLPISLGILAAFAMSAAATVLNRGEVYFDSVSALIALLLAGRLLLQRASRWAADASENLLSLSPRTARRIEGGGEREVLLTEIQIGDRLRVRPGETVPVDGWLASADGWIAEAHLSGEPGATYRARGDSLFAGSVVEQSPVEIAATAVGETTRLARLAEIMRNASVRRAPIVSLLDRVAAWFVAAVLTLAGATAAIWFFVDPSRALWNAAAVLVVACPCALGLATPVALAVAMGRAARRGVFIKGQDGVERLASSDHVILDKTGTLTEGSLSVIEQYFTDNATDSARVEILCAVAALEKQSGHVIATAFQDTFTEGVGLEDCRVLPGAGVEGRVNGQHLCAGSESFIAERVTELPATLCVHAVDAERRGLTVVWVARDHQAQAVFALGDSLRDDAAVAVHEMRRMGLELELLSGDHERAVARVAEELQITDFRGRVSPEQKLSRVEELTAQGKRTAMVGDGVNDAAALGRAYVGISAAGAADVARDAADVFISSVREPSAIAEAFALSRRAMRVVRINLWIAASYNLIGAALAVTGHVSPLVAAVLMPLSSLTVLLIAARA